METYKLGNRVKAILRAHSPGWVGNTEIFYSMQPYTILETTEATVLFRDTVSTAKTTQSLLKYDVDFVDSIELSNVKLTDKILNLIFRQDDQPLKTISINQNSSGHILPLPSDIVCYQLFVFDDEGQLVYAVDEAKDSIEVDKPDSNYLLVFLSDAEKGYYLSRQQNITLALDLEVIGNEDDTTNHFWLHFDKCSLGINKNLYFNGSVNSIDLRLQILKSDNDYITIK